MPKHQLVPNLQAPQLNVKLSKVLVMPLHVGPQLQIMLPPLLVLINYVLIIQQQLLMLNAFFSYLDVKQTEPVVLLTLLLVQPFKVMPQHVL